MPLKRYKHSLAMFYQNLPMQVPHFCKLKSPRSVRLIGMLLPPLFDLLSAYLSTPSVAGHNLRVIAVGKANNALRLKIHQWIFRSISKILHCSQSTLHRDDVAKSNPISPPPEIGRRGFYEVLSPPKYLWVTIDAASSLASIGLRHRQRGELMRFLWKGN